MKKNNVYVVSTDWKSYCILAKNAEHSLRKFNTLIRKEFNNRVPADARNIKSISMVASDVYE